VTLDLHRASVPVFAHYLDRLAGLVRLARTQAGAHPAGDLLDARLAPDMLPFAAQVAVAANFAPRCCCPLAGRAAPDLGPWPTSFDGLLDRIAAAHAAIDALDPADFQRGPERRITDRAGHASVALPAPEFLLQYGLPNFLFHVTTAYAILRAQGVSLSKPDYLQHLGLPEQL
jgi:hypothetical protein